MASLIYARDFTFTFADEEEADSGAVAVDSERSHVIFYIPNDTTGCFMEVHMTPTEALNLASYLIECADVANGEGI